MEGGGLDGLCSAILPGDGEPKEELRWVWSPLVLKDVGKNGSVLPSDAHLRVRDEEDREGGG